MVEVRMPKFGLSMEKGFITKWYKSKGDRVEKGEPLLEVESEKITNDVPSPATGFVKEVLVEEGSEAEVGKVIAYIAESEEELKEEVKKAPEKQPKESAPAESVQEEAKEHSLETPVRSGQTGFIKASPLAKRLAREHGIDLSTIKGSGPNGRIVEKDVLNALSKAAEETAEAPGKAQVEKLSPIRRTIAENLSEMYRKTVLVTNMTEVDMSSLLAFKKSLTEKVSVTAILVKVLAQVLKTLPKFNVNFDGETITRFESVNIGVAVSTKNGLIVPVVKNADKLTISQINAEIKRLSSRARSGELTGEETKGSHFTLTNLGMMRTDMFTPVLNKNEVAILGVGRTVKKVVVIEDDKFAVRDMAYFSLSYDHRVIDGADAAEFLGEVARIIESVPFVI